MAENRTSAMVCAVYDGIEYTATCIKSRPVFKYNPEIWEIAMVSTVDTAQKAVRSMIKNHYPLPLYNLHVNGPGRVQTVDAADVEFRIKEIHSLQSETIDWAG